MHPDIQTLLTDPSWFPHRLDWERGTITFVPTKAARLRALSFIDGRDDFSTGASVEAPVDALLAAAPCLPDSARYIFHISFCGSTLLATLLDQPGRVLALREPNILVDLANWHVTLGKQGSDDTAFTSTLRLAQSLLHRESAQGEAVLVKPSNWVNNLVPRLSGPAARAVTIGMDARAFILALFRGGRDRLAFNARAVSHIAMGDPVAETLVRRAIAGGGDPLDIMARLGALSHHVQSDLLRRCARKGSLRLDFAEITADPADAALRAADALGLPCSDIAPEHVTMNAKERGRDFSASARREADAVVEAAHGVRADAALEWLAATR